MTEVTRIILWNIPPALSLAMYLGSFLAASAVLWGIWRHAHIWRLGRSEDRFDNIKSRLTDTIIYALKQERLLSNRFRGAAHLLISVGFLMLFIATLLTAVQHNAKIAFLNGTVYIAFSFLADLFGAVLIAGVIFALYNRYVRRPVGLTTELEDIYVLTVLLALAVSGFLLEGARLAVTNSDWEIWSFVGYGVGRAFAALGYPSEIWMTVHRALWALHLTVAIVLFVSIPFTKLLHIFTSPLAVFFRSHCPSGTLRPEPAVDCSQRIGAEYVADFTWKQLFDLSACTKCGRCQDACPAWNSGKPLSPKSLILQLRRSALSSGNGIEGGFHSFVSPDELWSCTTCGACSHKCPIFIEHIDKIVDLRRRLVDRGEVSEDTAKALESMFLFGNPSQFPQSERAEWASGLGVKTAEAGTAYDYLYWVGCASAYDDVGRSISTALVKILKAAGISVTVLGLQEKCCGDPARRLGEEGLFQKLANENIAVLNSVVARRILTHCPHCYNVLKNEYPQLGGRFDVVHHSELISDLIDSGKIEPKQSRAQQIAFHDPCYLGRHNGIYDPPRRTLQAVPSIGLIEMEQNRANAFCCGGGGGQMWMETNIGKRINNLRFEQAEVINPDVLATACPYCKTMLDVAASYGGECQRIKIKDIAEIVYDSL